MINETHFLKKLESITLSTAKKSRMRENLSAYADMHSLVQTPSTASPYAFLFAFMEAKRFPLYASLMAVLLITGGGMTFAAEQSVPGDTLYALKVHVTEPVLTVLSPSAEGQARISARLATRRADEVVLLATRGQLTKEKEELLDSAFSKEVASAIERSDELEKKGDFEKARSVRADFAVSLAGEAQALGAVSALSQHDKGNFLRKIVATSQSVGRASEPTDSSESEVQDSSDVARTSTPKPLLGTSTEISMKKKSSTAAAKNSEARRARMLFITASTTFSGSINTANTVSLPKTDRAVPHTEDETEIETTIQNQRNLFGR